MSCYGHPWDSRKGIMSITKRLIFEELDERMNEEMERSTPRQRCRDCSRRMSWAECRVQYGRLLRHGLTGSEASEALPRCQKCVTKLSPERLANIAKGDRLRSEGKALPLCWLPPVQERAVWPDGPGKREDGKLWFE